MEGWVSIDDKKISIERGGHKVEVMWWDGWSNYFSLWVDDVNMLIYGWSDVYKRIVEPLVNGTAGEDVIECLKLIALSYRDKRTRSRYVAALAYIGPNVKKWIKRKPGTYLKRKASLVYRHRGSGFDDSDEYLLAFFCKNGWMVLDMLCYDVYAYVRDGQGLNCFMAFGGYRDCFSIVLAELLPSLKKDLRNIERLKDCGFDGWSDDSWKIMRFLKTIPKEWWSMLDIEALMVEQELRHLS
jgi:hypothetical protein